MASSKSYLDFILGQLSELEDISYRAMMGEYIIYYRGKIVGGIYDDRFLMKLTQSAVSMMPNADREGNAMFDYQKYFEAYCRDHCLKLCLSFDMPAGYETANGTFDFETKTVYINAESLSEAPDYEQAFCFFHELRHALQYLRPESFSYAIFRSLPYTIMFDGTCYKLVDGKYLECKLDGGEEYFTDIYIGQPYEVDANKYAYEQAKMLYGDSEELKKLYEFWTPSKPVPDELYDSIFAEIDEKIKHTRM